MDRFDGQKMLGRTVTVAQGRVVGTELPARVVGDSGDPFTGEVTAVWHRDEGDCLLVAPADVQWEQAELAERLAPLTRPGEIESLFQRSGGAIVYRLTADGVEFLMLLQSESRTWSLPKGHREAGEDMEQTVRRELREEIGTAVTFVPGFRVEVEYPLPIAPGAHKLVTLFLAQLAGEIVLDTVRGEILEYRWMSPDEAKRHLHPAYSAALDAAEAWAQRGADAK